jgi:hypothetical protein
VSYAPLQLQESDDRALEFRPPVAAHDLGRAVAALASEATPAPLVERIGACFKYLGRLVGSLYESLETRTGAIRRPPRRPRTCSGY